MPKDLLVLHYEKDGKQVEVAFDETFDPWLTQKQIADLLEITRQNVGQILTTAYRSQQLPPDTRIKLDVTLPDGRTYMIMHYSHDAIEMVAFRTRKSDLAIAFRHWVKHVLRSEIEADLNAEVLMEMGRADSYDRMRIDAELRADWAKIELEDALEELRELKFEAMYGQDRLDTYPVGRITGRIYWV